MTSDTAPPQRGNRLKWAWAAAILVAVLAVALAAKVLFAQGEPAKDAAGSPKSAAPSAGIASANDTGPVSVITEDPSCLAWTPINNTLSNIGEGIWNDRDRSIPASAWTPKQRAQYQAAGQTMRIAAAQTLGLVKLTPHRVMRELYEQFIAYARAYADRIPNYTPSDNNLAGTANSAASALGSICTAIADGTAAARGPLVAPPAPPAQTSPPGNPANPRPFVASRNPVCADWKSALDRFGAQTAAWQHIDPNIPATRWTPEQKAANYAAARVMNADANALEQLGRRSGNPTLQDFAELAAQYRRAFVLAVPTYTPADNHLANAANYTSTTILGACAAVGG